MHQKILLHIAVLSALAFPCIKTGILIYLLIYSIIDVINVTIESMNFKSYVKSLAMGVERNLNILPSTTHIHWSKINTQ
jgi:hypothetical protein